MKRFLLTSKQLFALLLFLLLLLLPSAARATTCGNTGAQVSTDSGDSGLALAIPDCVPSVNSTVQSCVVGVATASGNIECAIYADSAGSPTGSPLCQSASTAATTGLNTLPLSGCGTLAAGSTYHIAVSPDNNTLAFARNTDSAATDHQQAMTYPTFPTGGTWSSIGAFSFQFYLNITASGTGVAPISKRRKLEKLGVIQ